MQQLLTIAEMANTGNKWAIITIDETYYWDKEIIKKAKKTECVYMVHLHEPTHCCELSVSFPALALRNVLQDISGFDEDELYKLEMEGTANEWRYYSANFTAKVVKYYGNEEEEEVLEYESCNPAYC